MIKLLFAAAAVCILLASCSTHKPYDPYNGLTEPRVKDSVRAVVQRMYNDVLGTVATISININSVKPVSEKSFNQFLYSKKLRMVNEAMARLDTFLIKYPNFDSTIIMKDKRLISREKQMVDSLKKK